MVSASALYNLRGCIASRFRIAALVLHCLRLNLTSRLRLQGCVPAACWALPGANFHRTVLFAPNRRTLTAYIISLDVASMSRCFRGKCCTNPVDIFSGIHSMVMRLFILLSAFCNQARTAPHKNHLTAQCSIALKCAFHTDFILN